MSLAATVRAMVAAGATGEVILAVVEAHEARRIKDAARQKAKRTRDSHAESRGQPVTSRESDEPPPRAQVVIPSLPSLRSEELGVGGGGTRERVQPTDDWPNGNGPHLAKLLVEAVESPWLDPHKSLDLNTTTGRLVAWKRDGASWEHDVLPVVRTLCANRRSRVASWKYFDDAIARSIADNRAALEIPAAGSVRATGPPSFAAQISAEHAEARRRVLES
jgi:hypothetical protein